MLTATNINRIFESIESSISTLEVQHMVYDDRSAEDAYRDYITDPRISYAVDTLLNIGQGYHTGRGYMHFEHEVGSIYSRQALAELTLDLVHALHKFENDTVGAMYTDEQQRELYVKLKHVVEELALIHRVNMRFNRESLNAVITAGISALQTAVAVTDQRFQSQPPLHQYLYTVALMVTGFVATIWSEFCEDTQDTQGIIRDAFDSAYLVKSTLMDMLTYEGWTPEVL